MTLASNYTPKVGDEVSVSGKSGRFLVRVVNDAGHTVEAKHINPKEYVENAQTHIAIPWSDLTPAKRSKREDLNQAAARIIRESTERD